MFLVAAATAVATMVAKEELISHAYTCQESSGIQNEDLHACENTRYFGHETLHRSNWNSRMFVLHSSQNLLHLIKKLKMFVQ